MGAFPWAAFLIWLAVTAAVFPLSGLIDGAGLTEQRRGLVNIFYVLFARFEPTAALLALTSMPVVLLAIWRRRADGPLDRAATRLLGGGRIGIMATAVAVGLFAWIAAGLVHHNYPLSMDEYGAEFQAELILDGRWAAPIDPSWRPFAQAMTPVFITLHGEPLQWTSHYLPVYGALKAIFLALGLPALLNVLCAAGSVWLVAAVARRLWPRHAAAPMVAVLLLALSPQFLVMSSTFYSLPAHLALNLLWLHLYLRDDRRSMALLPWVGVAAMGLHQFVMHSMFAAPFLAWVVLQRRFKRAAYFALVYLAGLAAWWGWLRLMRPVELDGAVAGAMGLPGPMQWLNQALNVALTFNWQSPVLIIGVLVAVGSWRSLSAVERCLVLSCLTTFVFYWFFLPDQGHGWGYRYMYPVLGNMALLAALGCKILSDRLGEPAGRSFVMVGLGATLVLVLPWRLVEVETTVRPFAEARAALMERPESVLVLDMAEIWYGNDLIRNDPLFRDTPRLLRPVAGMHGDPTWQRWMAREDVGFVSHEELLSYGLTPAPELP